MVAAEVVSPAVSRGSALSSLREGAAQRVNMAADDTSEDSSSRHSMLLAEFALAQARTAELALALEIARSRSNRGSRASQGSARMEEEVMPTPALQSMQLRPAADLRPLCTKASPPIPVAPLLDLFVDSSGSRKEMRDEALRRAARAAADASASVG